MTKRVRKRKMEFSKKLVIWTVVIMTSSMIMSFGLAAFGRETAYEVTTAAITAGVPIVVAQLGKSLGEKHSRNKYGLDRNGRPFTVKSPEEEGAGESTEDEICG